MAIKYVKFHRKKEKQNESASRYGFTVFVLSARAWRRTRTEKRVPIRGSPDPCLIGAVSVLFSAVSVLFLHIVFSYERLPIYYSIGQEESQGQGKRFFVSF